MLGLGSWRRHGPARGLAQLDHLLYLDEPVPGIDRLGVVVACRGCRTPDVDARGRVCYATLDPGVSRHAREIDILLEAAR